MKKPPVSYRIKKFFAKMIRPIFFWVKKHYPERFEGWIKSAETLDLSAMLRQFNWLHRLFFRKTLTRIRIEGSDLEKIRDAAEQGPIIYMMRNWGQIEYNYFNTLFLQEKLPLASHANLIRMHWWMPLKTRFHTWIARLDFFYQNGEFPEVAEKNPLAATLAGKKPLFLFLNLPPVFAKDEIFRDDTIVPLLGVLSQLGADKPATVLPLTLVYDRRPGKARRSVIDILFGEKENPGSLRKTVLFFRNAKKRAVAQVGDPFDLKGFLKSHGGEGLGEKAIALRQELHHIFFKEQQAITGPRLKSRARMMELVLQDPHLRDALKEISPEFKKPLDELYLESEKILEEIVSDPNYWVIDLWSVVLTGAFRTLYDGLIIDEAGLNRVKQVARHSPLVLIPSHRSHVDYLLLAYIFYQQNLSMPLVATGDNLSFWPLGYIFRRSGAYFLRRSFGSDKLYPLLFKAYVKTLIREGYFQEFFIEGTRSRTGKLENPRTGLLSIFLDSYFEGVTDDLYFIPISIDYEKVLEEGSYVEEVKGATKKSERFWDLFRIGKIFKHRSGKVYVSFGEPISVKDYAARKDLKPEDADKKRKDVVKKLSYRIAREIEDVSVATAPALVATGLLSQPKKGQTLSELMDRIEMIRKALSLRNVTLSEPLRRNYPQALHQTLQRYKSQGILLEHHDGVETFFTLEEARRIQLNYYKNSLLHNLIHLSLLATVLSGSKEPFYSPEAAEKIYGELSQIYRFEFIQILNYREAHADLTALGVIAESGDGQGAVRSLENLQVFSTLFRNFIEAYALTALFLQRNSFSKVDEKTLVKRILQLGQKLILKGDLSRPEAISRFVIQNALRSFRDRGLVQTHEKESGKAGLKLYSSAEAKEGLEEVLKLLKGDTFNEARKAPPLYLLQR